MKSSKKLLFAIFAIIAIFILLRITFSSPISPQQTIPVSIRLKWLHQSQFAGLYVAKEKNMYQKYGLDVTLKEREFKTKTPIEELIDGETDFAIVNPIELLTAIGNGKKIKAVAAFFQNSPSVLISLDEDRIASPRDFKGKILGIVTDGSESKFIYKDLLAQYGLSEYDISYKLVGSEQIENLIKRNVDVIHLYRTSGFVGMSNKGLNYNFMLPEEYGLSFYDDILVTTDNYIKEKPDAIKNVIRATKEGWLYTKNNQKEAIEISMKYANKLYKNKEDLSDILYQVIQLMWLDDKTQLYGMDSVKWKVMINKLNAQDILKKQIKVEDVYTNAFLEGN